MLFCSKPSFLARRSTAFLLALVFGCLLNSLPVAAEASCTWRDVDNPARQVIDCGDTLTVERERAAQITIFERANGAAPRAIEIKIGTILIDVEPGSAPTQIRTPHAIAAVRGTTYVVEVSADGTSVFVLEGQVDVRKPAGGSVVSLEAGQGIDVTAEQPLNATNWDQERASALRARFGR